MNKYREIEVTIRSGLQIIRLNRPQKKNAITTLMYNEIMSALDDAKKNEKVSIAALTGAGDFYSSGNDLSTYLSYAEDIDKAIKEGSQRVNKFVSSFIDFPKILVAVVNGPAIGVAATTLGLCDVVYASNKASFQTPFASSGLSAEGCSSYTFPRIMGTSLASEMLFFDRKINAQDAKACGLASDVYLHEHANQIWEKLEKNSQLPALSMHYTKQLVRHFAREDLHEANDNECKRLEERWRSEECMSAVLKFFERRSKI